MFILNSMFLAARPQGMPKIQKINTRKINARIIQRRMFHYKTKCVLWSNFASGSGFPPGENQISEAAQ
jgi:hypothetical protein